MTATYKILAQSNPSASTNTDIYTVGSGKSAVCSTLAVCNQGSSIASFNVALRQGGATLASQQYIAYGTPIQGNDILTFSIGLTLAATDVVTVNANTSSVSFNLLGTELS
jgi:succinate dehydrogenase/fumarate reductase flavoprotein subunit